jgi:hypothetical protein
MQLDILGVVRETQDKILSRLGGSFDVGLTPEQFKSIQNNNIFYRQDIELAPGSYSIDLIVRDRISGKTTAKREKLDLPVADSELSFSAIVLSRHVEPAPKQPASGAPGDVLSQGGVQIRPSPSREFNTRDNLIIFFELYNAALRAETGKPSVKITLRLIKDSKAMVKPISYELTEISSEPTPHLTFAKYVSLEGLPEGRYAAKIEARDTVTGKLIEQQSAFVIVR